MLSLQGFDVVCCTISMFNDCRKYNRKSIKKYREIYIKVPTNILVKRNQKNLYKHNIKNSKSDVVGISQKFEEPTNPDIIIENDGSITPAKITEKYYKKIKI